MILRIFGRTFVWIIGKTLQIERFWGWTTMSPPGDGWGRFFRNWIEREGRTVSRTKTIKPKKQKKKKSNFRNCNQGIFILNYEATSLYPTWPDPTRLCVWLISRERRMGLTCHRWIRLWIKEMCYDRSEKSTYPFVYMCIVFFLSKKNLISFQVDNIEQQSILASE